MVKIEIIIPTQTEINRVYKVIKKELIGVGYEIIKENSVSGSVSWGEIFLKKFPRKNKEIIHGEFFLSSTIFRKMKIFSYSEHFTKTIKGMDFLLNDFKLEISIEEYY